MRAISVRRCGTALLAAALLLLLGLPPTGGPGPASASVPVAVDPPAPIWGVGDVFISKRYGNEYHEYTPAGAPVRQLAVPDNGPVAGLFDLQGDLLVATFFGPIDEFDPQGNFVGVFADVDEGTSDDIPGSLSIDASGHVFVGSETLALGAHAADIVREYTPDGNLVDQFRVRVSRDREVDAMDLAADQCTLAYVSGPFLLTYDVCTHTQGTPLQRHLVDRPTGLRLLPSGEMLTSDYRSIQLRSATGQVLRTYLPPPTYSGNFSDLALDPDGVSFWTIDDHQARVFRIRISDGQLLRRFLVHSYDGGDDGEIFIGSLAVYGEPTVGRTTAPPASTRAQR